MDNHIHTRCIYSRWNLSGMVSAQVNFEIWAGPEQLHHGAWDVIFLLDKEAILLYSQPMAVHCAVTAESL